MGKQEKWSLRTQLREGEVGAVSQLHQETHRRFKWPGGVPGCDKRQHEVRERDGEAWAWNDLLFTCSFAQSPSAHLRYKGT